MMKELISRRLKRGNLPDLLLIDGGRGQLAVVKRVVDDLKISDLELAAIAKGKDGEMDKVYRPKWTNPRKGKKDDPAYLLLMKLRDEAHRFGINAQKRSRSKKLKSS